MSNIRTIGGLTILKLISGVLGIVYSIFQVKYFGATRLIEIFFAAQSVVYLITSLTQSGQLAEVFLPQYIHLKNNFSETLAHQAYSVVVNRIGVYVLLLLGIGFFFAPFLMRYFVPGFSIEDQAQGVVLFRAFLPLIFLQIQASFLLTILNAEKIYGRAEIAGIVNLILSIIILIIFNSGLGIWAILLALYVGKIIELLFYIFTAFKKKIRYFLIWKSQDFDHHLFFKTILSTFTYTGGTQIYNWAVTASISFLPEGTYAIFTYVQRLFSKISGIVIQPISIVFFSNISEAITQGFNEKAKNILANIQTIGLLIGCFIFTLLFLIGYDCLYFLWFGDTFSIENLILADQFLKLYFLLFILALLYVIHRKFAMAIGSAKLIYKFQAVAQLINAALAFFLITNFELVGLFISIMLCNTLLMLIPFLLNKWKLKENFPKVSLKYSLKLLSIVFITLNSTTIILVVAIRYYSNDFLMI